MKPIERVIFVCTGNTCRSPMAESIYASMELSEGIEIISRGLVVLFQEPVNPKAEAVLKNHELDMNHHITRQFQGTDSGEGALVLTMTEQQKHNIITEYQIESSCYTLKEYAGESGDVVDPYGGSLMDYEDCFHELSRLVRKAAYRIAKENESSC